MMHRIVLVFLLLLCSGAVIAGLACGKYGRPERISQPQPQVAAIDTEIEIEIEEDRDEAPKNRKP